MDLATRYRDLLEQGLHASQVHDASAALALFDQAAALAPGEAMPHFLIGSEHAAEGAIDAAEAAFANAVLLAPAFHLARYQLGLLQFTSRRPGAALVTWQPLQALPADDPLGHFVRGFAALAGERFVLAIQAFRDGLGCCQAQSALAADIERVVAALERIDPHATPGQPAAGGADSAPPGTVLRASPAQRLH